MKNRITAMLLTIAAILTLTGCGGERPDISMETVRAAIDEAAPAETLPVMMEYDAAAIKTYYGLGAAEVEAFSGQISLLNVSAAEVLIICAQRNKADVVLQAAETRKAVLEERWRAADETQYALVQDCRIVQSGDWLLFVIAEAANEISESFITCIDSQKS